MPNFFLEAPSKGQPQEETVFLEQEEERQSSQGLPEAEEKPQEAQEGAQEEVQEKPEEAPKKEQPLIGGKFKSYEDLLKSYEEAQRELTRRSQELAKLQAQYDALWRQIAGTQEGSQQVYQVPQDDNEFLQQFLASPRKALEALLQQYVTPLQTTLTKFQIEQRTNHWVQREKYYEEVFGQQFSALKPRIYDYIRQNPHLVNKRDGYDEAVKYVVGEMALSGKVVPPKPPSVEPPKPAPSPQYSREVVEFARRIGKKPEEAKEILERLKAGQPVPMEVE
jgi:hypothetical protein